MTIPVPPPSPSVAQELAHPRQARRLALHQQMWTFHQQGWPGWTMAQQLAIGSTFSLPPDEDLARAYARRRTAPGLTGL